MIHDDQPLYAETKPSEWVPYQFAQALLETKPVVEKDAAGADPDADGFLRPHQRLRGNRPSTLWSKTSRIRGGKGKFQLRPNPEYFTKVLEDGIPGNVILFDLKGKHFHSGSVLGLANNMDAFRGRYCVGTTDAEVGVPFYATIDLVAPLGQIHRRTWWSGQRTSEPENTGTARRCRTPAWGRKGPARYFAPLPFQEGQAREQLRQWSRVDECVAEVMEVAETQGAHVGVNMKAPAVQYLLRSFHWLPALAAYLFVVHRLQAVRGDELVFSETDASTVAFPDALKGMSDGEKFKFLTWRETLASLR